ncbi:hypothetical protein SAMN04488085_11042 [Geodermatophilus ruber]|uniref:Uncharacterized protein n=1 Tax=Geodermatophilus ruber TaxID=504800 RepID=A0A1I4H7L1_9ACTN|nr:hypothetical protein SAMN04488085_11042 [Geodermatophilus ruber]
MKLTRSASMAFELTGVPMRMDVAYEGGEPR